MDVFNDISTKRKELINGLYDSVDYSNLKFEFVGSTKDVSFYEYMNSKELFNAIKSSKIKFAEARNKQNEFLNKVNNIKIGKKSLEQKKVISNLEKFYNSREEVINFFRDAMLSECRNAIGCKLQRQTK